ncbi:MAG: glutamate--tRNA ligase [Tenericutes bacterium GWC2_34_14]|nr:MAG: glutamate--tRNA ligase [Tenericutes bacterium GWA2_35_7]OHE28999.1 MAG: glutamate--tRNA ligase [Tenericutes bacterium GWC2_34_14]OHE33952.1 MAG: glutamate--tRNA ligase [Tenericutes bacterium GWE2_34_108]OHE35285.1 MAG: glutamate--tRNA ligase [Tenericutes bacterium GWF1_35_14]OHE38318.1 MAG: glutamate--tRNA ligase [Tenericutes bacterium GWF2_35_184]OHE42493.1 MAG: glutamate--tRNA ligase [Tenericutes bacterium RIFOXYA12_FULL_35_10]OHE42653.1 MAG: glutamate--tRNA ligase [Tenericutes bact
MEHKTRVRYAPSPTGQLHIGNARSALFNYLYARHFGGDFIVRIEDTDVLRNVPGGEESQLSNLKWLGLDWDESPDKGGPYGPYRQLERLETYKEYAEKLLEMGYAYKEYRENSKKYAIRFKVPNDVELSFKDLVRGELKFHSKDVEDWIMVKDNGIPTYNFAVVIDDHLMKITHVLRGEEHITNTPKQILVYRALGWKVPEFGHMTIIVNEQKKKLSKRDKNVIQFIKEYQDMGYLPEAMFNFISLLGWSPQGNEEILTQEDIIEQFDPSRLSKAPAMFDKNKLAYINSRYIKKLSVEELSERCRPYLVKAGISIPTDDWLKLLVGILQDRMSYLGEIVELHRAFFHDDFEVKEEAFQFLVDNQSAKLLETFKHHLMVSDFSPEAIEPLIKQTGLDTQTKGKPLFMGLRIATTGDMHGPSLPISLALLGKDRVIHRLNQTITKLRGES